MVFTRTRYKYDPNNKEIKSLSPAGHYKDMHQQKIIMNSSFDELIRFIIWCVCQFRKPKRSTSNAKACFRNTAVNELLNCLSSSRMMYQHCEEIIMGCRRMATHWTKVPVADICSFVDSFEKKINRHIVGLCAKNPSVACLWYSRKGPVVGELMMFIW